jgi:hypothetical protein
MGCGQYYPGEAPVVVNGFPIGRVPVTSRQIVCETRHVTVAESLDGCEGEVDRREIGTDIVHCR